MFEPAFLFELLHGREDGGVGDRPSAADGFQQLRDGGLALFPDEFHDFALQRSESVERFVHGKFFGQGYLRRIDVRRFIVVRQTCQPPLPPAIGRGNLASWHRGAKRGPPGQWPGLRGMDSSDPPSQAE